MISSMRLKILVLAVVALALGASEAQARPFEALEEQAYAVAIAAWGQEPSLCASLEKTVEPLGGVWGQATQPTQAGETCNLRVDPSAVEAGPATLCLVETHEVGHLLGLGHSEDPNSVMHEPPVLSSVPQCEEWSLEALEEQQLPFLEAIERRQDWGEWKELRAECRESRGPWQQKCWRRLHRQAARIRASAGSG